MSLLQSLSYREYKKALFLSVEECRKIARLADLSISFSNTTKPGEHLIKELDRKGHTLQQYNNLIAGVYVKTILTYYKPQTKVAILVANDKYIHLSKLATPSIDSDSIGVKLQDLGFIVVTIKNTSSHVFKEIFEKICEIIPEDSYGHGCQICNTKCLLGTECPPENITIEDCVTENFIMKQFSNCKLDLCICIMDTCRIYLDRNANPQIYNSMLSIEEYGDFKNLLISYSCLPAQAAYEVLQIECSTTINTDITYELRTGDTDKIVQGASQYVNALCTRLGDDTDVSSMLDRVHADVEHSTKNQRPLKIQCGMAKRSLYDPVIGDHAAIIARLQEVARDYGGYCSVY